MAVPDLPGDGHNPTTGATIPSSWGDDVNAVAEWLMSTKPRARVYRAAVFNHTDSADWMSIPMGNEGSPAYDIGGCHDTVTDTERLTAPEDGLYLMGGSLVFDSDATGLRGIRIVVNGSEVVQEKLEDAITTIKPMALGGFDFPLEAGDYITLDAYQNTGSPLAMTPTGDYSHVLWFRWVATI